MKKEGLQFREALGLLKHDVMELAQMAGKLRIKNCGRKMNLCSLINAKSGLCPEDCHFCAQSLHHQTGVKEYPFVALKDILSRARRARSYGANSFCIVISGRGPNEKELSQIIQAVRNIKRETGLSVDCSLGFLEEGALKELKRAGVDMFNHNLEAAESFYKKICTTHTYAGRVNMVRRIKAAGIAACCGGIIGMGETWQERLRLAFHLRELEVECVPINILNPRPGTPLENVAPIAPLDIIKTIALFRLILPRAIIKVAGGRERALRELQALAFLAGANGMIVGGYLTTKGRSVKQDLQMVRDLGMDLRE